ncbi:hypothetical protein [Glutamicibacter creatinolyticus]|uniref:hypothetical protein n=1 Tax=Glutamicibacter creatinolyticus TaxID=162496 RepID=UPI003217E2A1
MIDQGQMIARLGGIEFGGLGDLIIQEFDPGDTEITVNDANIPMGDGVMVGRDFLGGKTWGFTLATSRADVEGARRTAAQLGAVWRSPSIRRTPGAVVPLSYRVGSQWRRVYGRPGRWADPIPDVRAMQGVMVVACDFRVTDPRHFAEDESVVTLTIIPETTGGLIVPLAAPLRTAVRGGQRAGLVDNRGDVETPLTVTFHGPCRDPKVVAAAGWEIGLTGSLAYDVSVTVDALTRTVTRSDGADVPGMLTRATQLSTAVLPVGQSDITFTCIDDTGTAKAVLAYRDAYTTL